MSWVLSELAFPRAEAAVGEASGPARAEDGQAGTGRVRHPKRGPGKRNGSRRNRHRARSRAVSPRLIQRSRREQQRGGAGVVVPKRKGEIVNGDESRARRRALDLESRVAAAGRGGEGVRWSGGERRA